MRLHRGRALSEGWFKMLAKSRRLREMGAQRGEQESLAFLALLGTAPKPRSQREIGTF